MIIVINTSLKEMDFLLKKKIEQVLGDLISVEGFGVYRNDEIIISKKSDAKKGEKYG